MLLMACCGDVGGCPALSHTDGDAVRADAVNRFTMDHTILCLPFGPTVSHDALVFFQYLSLASRTAALNADRACT